MQSHAEIQKHSNTSLYNSPQPRSLESTRTVNTPRPALKVKTPSSTNAGSWNWLILSKEIALRVGFIKKENIKEEEKTISN